MDFTGIRAFVEAVKAIRSPNGGCPWDLAQTHESLIPYFREELEEFIEALQNEGPTSPHTWEELGDVLLQVVLHAEMASEKGFGDFDQIALKASEKLIERHPHVFDPSFPKFKTAAEVNQAWESIKARIKAKKSPKSSAEPSGKSGAESTAESAPEAAPGAPARSPARSGAESGWAGRSLLLVPDSLGGLQKASRLGEKAASFGFDWPTADSVLDKLKEECTELLESHSPDHQKEELGDIFFVLAQYSRKKGWDPEEVLRLANLKFKRRFDYLSEIVGVEGLQKRQFSLEELESAWQKVKQNEKKS